MTDIYEVEIDGQVFEVEGQPTEKVIASLRSQFGKKKEGPGFWKSMVRAPGQMGNVAITGLAQAAAGLAGNKKYQDAILDFISRQDEYWNAPEDQPTTFAGKAGKAIGSLPSFINPMIAATTIAGMGAQTGRELVKEGASTGAALAGQAIDTGLGAAGLALPVGLATGRARNAIAGGTINVGQEVGNIEAQNAVRRSEGIRELPRMDAGDVLIAAAPGVAFGAMNPKTAAKDTSPKPSITPDKPDQAALIEKATNDIATRAKFAGEKIQSIQTKMNSIKGQAEEIGWTEKQKAYYERLGEQLEQSNAEFEGLVRQYESITKGQPKAAEPEAAPVTNPDPAGKVESTTTRTEVGDGETAPVPTTTPLRDTGTSLYEAGRPRTERRQIDRAWEEQQGVVDPTTKAIQEELAWKQHGDDVPPRSEADYQYEVHEAVQQMLDIYNQKQKDFEQRLRQSSDITQAEINAIKAGRYEELVSKHIDDFERRSSTRENRRERLQGFENEVDLLTKQTQEELAWIAHNKQKDTSNQGRPSDIHHQLQEKYNQPLIDFNARGRRTEDQLRHQGDMTSAERVFNKQLADMAAAADAIARRQPTHPARSFPGDPETKVDTNLVAAIDSGGFYGGLKHIVDTMPDTPLGEVATKLMNNRNVDPDVQLKLGERSAAAEMGTFESAVNSPTNPKQGTVSLWDKGKNAITFVHEAVHAASAATIARWKANDLTLSIPQRVAVKNLDKLYKHVQGLKIGDKFANAMNNLDEFLAYGMTDHSFQSKLASIRYDGGNALTAFAKRVANMLGFDTKGATALDQLLSEGGKIVDMAGASGYRLDGKGKVLQQVDPALRRELEHPVRFKAPDTMLQIMNRENIPEVKGGLMVRLYQRVIGDQQFGELLRTYAPYAYNTLKVINEHTRQATVIENHMLNNVTGNSSGLKNVGPFRLDHQAAPISVKELWTKNVKTSDIVAVQDVMVRGFSDPADPISIRKQADAQLQAQRGQGNLFEIMGDLARQQYERNLTRHGQGLTEHQKNMYKAATEMFVQGIIYGKIKEPRAGWYPATRRGDHAVALTYNGVVVHLETFRDKAQADWFIEQSAKNLPDMKANYNDMSADDSLRSAYTTIHDLIKDSAGRAMTPAESAAIKNAGKTIDDIMERMAMFAKFGQHEVHRTDVGGALGSRLFQSRNANALDFQRAISGMPHEWAVIHKKRALTQIMQRDILNDGLIRSYPVQADISARMIENTLNDKPVNAAAKFGQWVHEKANRAHSKMIIGINNGIAKGVAAANKMFGSDVKAYEFQMPDINVVERTTGVMAQPFYAHALTSRPSFCVAQKLTAPFALRQVIVEAAMFNDMSFKTLSDTITAVAKGLVSASGGHQPDWWKAAMKSMIQDTYSIQPQFHNEVNDPVRGALGHNHETFKNIYEYGTGTKMSAFADSSSRFDVASVALHLFHAQGYRGSDLVAAASGLTDKTMVQYERQHTPPILNELGTAGQLIAPLMKYPIAQMANLVNDVRFAGKNFDKNAIVALAPAVSTIVTSAIIAGSFGTAVAVEYEVLRTLLKALYGIGGWAITNSQEEKDALSERMFGETEFDEILPPLPELLFKQGDIVGKTLKSMYETITPQAMQEAHPRFAENAAMFGAPSALTGPMLTEIGNLIGVDMAGEGFDIGSGLRFQEMFGKILHMEDPSILDAMPIVNWYKETFSEAVHAAASGTEAERYKAKRNFSPFVGARLLADETIAKDRGYIPKIGKDHIEDMKEVYDNTTRIASFMGSSTIWSKKTGQNFEEAKRTKRIEESIDIRLQKLMDKARKGEDVQLGAVYKLAGKVGKTPVEVASTVMNHAIRRSIDPNVRFMIGTDLTLSMKEMAQIAHMNDNNQQEEQ